jgi:hypothetical protein
MLTHARKLAVTIAAAASLGAGLAGMGTAVAQPAAGRAQALDLRVTVGLIPGSGTTLHYRGTFAGAPFGRGTVDLRSTMGGAGDAHIAFVMANRRGTVRGVSDVTMAFHGSTVTVRGKASITEGTGAYRSVRARGLRFSGTNAIADVHSTLRLMGRISA